MHPIPYTQQVHHLCFTVFQMCWFRPNSCCISWLACVTIILNRTIRHQTTSTLFIFICQLSITLYTFLLTNWHVDTWHQWYIYSFIQFYIHTLFEIVTYDLTLFIKKIILNSFWGALSPASNTSYQLAHDFDTIMDPH